MRTELAVMRTVSVKRRCGVRGGAVSLQKNKVRASTNQVPCPINRLFRPFENKFDLNTASVGFGIKARSSLVR